MRKFLLICLLALPISCANLHCYYNNGRILKIYTNIVISIFTITSFIRIYKHK